MYNKEKDYRNETLKKWTWFDSYVKEKMELDHYALHRFYTSVFRKYIFHYNGRFGEGVKLIGHFNNRYSLITYYIFKPSVSEKERKEFIKELMMKYI